MTILSGMQSSRRSAFKFLRVGATIRGNSGEMSDVMLDGREGAHFLFQANYPGKHMAAMTGSTL